MTPLFRSDRPVTLIGGGDVLAVDAAAAVALAPVVMAADGGADTALALGLMPDAVVGDFDSIGDAARAAIPAERLHRIAEQDSTWSSIAGSRSVSRTSSTHAPSGCG